MKATLIKKIDEASNITTFYFKPDRLLRFVAGQFIELAIPHNSPDNRGYKRWFTISSAPGHELIAITTKRSDKGSTYKKALWKLEENSKVDISEAMGDFVLPMDDKIPLVFIAGGIGITPYRSIVQWLEDNHKQRQIQLIYSSHSEEEIVFRDTFTKTYIDKTERINQQNLTAVELVKLVNGIDGKQIYISGPEPMTEALVEQFKKLGIKQNKLITDYFPGYSA